jgi:hypothetical protein
MSNGVLALGQLSPQLAPLELGCCENSSLDPVKQELHAAKGVVIGEVELGWCLVAAPDVRVTASLFALDLPFWWILPSARHLCQEVLQDHGPGVGKPLGHIPVLLRSDLRWNLLSAVHWVVEMGLHLEALGDVGHQPGQVDLESWSLYIVEPIFVA